MSTGPFSPTSRYAGIEVAHWVKPDGGIVPYVRRRFIPAPERFALLQEHRVAEGDRVDNLAAQYLGDPEQFWRLCDANNVLRPDALTEQIGQPVRITLPEGVPGATHG